MTYSTEQKNEAARLFCTFFLNAHYGVIRHWVTYEAGANNNVFGVTINGVLQRYPTMEAGVRAAATRIKTLVVYRALRDALDSPHSPRVGCPSFGKHANAQASAICRSPWHSGVAGVRAQGGLDLYYTKLFELGGYTIS